MKRKILGTVIALSIAIGAVPLTEIPAKAMENDGAVTPSTTVKTIMRGTTGIKPQTTEETIDNATTPPTYTYTCDKGSSIYFGSYPQTKKSDNKPATGEGTEWVEGKQGDTIIGYYSIDPIEWRVLANGSTDGLFLLSEKNLDVVQYDRYDTGRWSTSEIRGWLNDISQYNYYKDESNSKKEKKTAL